MLNPSWLLAGPGRNWQKGEQLRKLTLAEPGAAFDELAPEVAKVRDRAAERGQPELEERSEHFHDGANSVPLHVRGVLVQSQTGRQRVNI